MCFQDRCCIHPFCSVFLCYKLVTVLSSSRFNKNATLTVYSFRVISCYFLLNSFAVLLLCVCFPSKRNMIWNIPQCSTMIALGSSALPSFSRHSNPKSKCNYQLWICSQKWNQFWQRLTLIPLHPHLRLIFIYLSSFSTRA